MRPRLLPLALVMVLAAVGACGKKPDAAGPGGPGGPGGGPPTVTVAHPLVGRVLDWDDYIGRFEAVEQVQLRARVSGLVQSVAFKNGQMVHKGQLLFTIDPRPLKATYDQARGQEANARATLALARADYERAAILLKANAISKEDYDTKAAAVQQDLGQLATAQANTRAAALNLSFTRVTAPISGRASDRRVDPGNQVNGGSGASGDLLTTIVTIDPIRFTFEGSEALYLKYSRLNGEGSRTSSRYAANPVDIRLQDESTYRWKGHMEFVDNAIDPGSGTIRAKALVQNPTGFLTPGMFGHMRLLGSGPYDAMMIPDPAISSDQARKLVSVVTDKGVVATKEIELGPLHNGLRIVRNGLALTDYIVIGGGGAVFPGTRVKTKEGKITEPAPGASPEPSQLAIPAASSTATTAGG